jgi:hypothetical protein
MLHADFLASQLRAGLQKLVSKDTVLASPSLCALVTAENALPESALVTDPLFVRLHQTEAELAAACHELSLAVTDAGAIRLPYRLTKHRLELHTTAPEQLLKHWLCTLSGCDAIELERRCDFFLMSTDEANAFAIWRALAVVPFFGEFIDVRMHWEELPVASDGTPLLQAQLAAKVASPAPKRSVRQRKNQRGRKKDWPQFEWVAERY